MGRICFTFTVNGTFILKSVLCLQPEILERIEAIEAGFEQLRQELQASQVSFMNIGNVPMVNMIAENSQIQRAVHLQRHVNCEMQLNVFLNVHVADTVPNFNAIKCVSRYQNTLYVCYIQLIHIYTHKKTHIALSSVQHTVQSHFTYPTDTLHTEFDTLRRSHKQF